MRNELRGGMTPQAYLLYKNMMNGKIINRKTALNEFGVQNLTARISEFRDKGVRFQTIYYRYDNSSGKTERDAHYLMKMEDRKYNLRYIASV